ncbi:MAG: hypothetical protein CMJ58_15005 [Planctomycetaceae bacterium]|nr:hypothetical protein [Planctomycetaceae bacterium]
MKPRFSLKLLLMAVTATALFCYWRTRPAAISHRFVEAAAKGDYATADQLLITPSMRKLDQWERENREIRVWLHPQKQTVLDWLAGRMSGQIVVEGDINGPGMPPGSPLHLNMLADQHFSENGNPGRFHWSMPIAVKSDGIELKGNQAPAPAYSWIVGSRDLPFSMAE